MGQANDFEISAAQKKKVSFNVISITHSSGLCPFVVMPCDITQGLINLLIFSNTDGSRFQTHETSTSVSSTSSHGNTEQGTTEGSNSRYRKVFEKLQTKLTSSLSAKASRRRSEKEHLETLKQVNEKVKNLDLGVHTELEYIAGGNNTALLAVTPSIYKEIGSSTGPFYPVKLLISPGGKYELRINIVDCVEAGNVDLEDCQALRKIVSQIAKGTTFRKCPGLQRNQKYLELVEKLGYKAKNVFSKDWPWRVARHVNCAIWHEPNNSHVSLDLEDCCTNCKVLSRELERMIARRERRQVENDRQSAQSRHRIDYLSPESKTARIKNIKGERRFYKKIAKKYWKMSKVDLGDKENAELLRLVKEIESSEKGQVELEKVFEEAEASKAGRGCTLEELWKIDCRDFIKDQRKNSE